MIKHIYVGGLFRLMQHQMPFSDESMPLIIDAMYNLGTFSMVRKKYKQALEVG